MRTSSQFLIAVLILFGIGIVAFLGLFIGPFVHAEYIGSSTSKRISEWSREEVETVWRESKALSDRSSTRHVITASQLPAPLREAGFETATVDPTSFLARRGGSSYGSVGAIVWCEFESSESSEPHMRYSGGTYSPDGRWERKQP